MSSVDAFLGGVTPQDLKAVDEAIIDLESRLKLLHERRRVLAILLKEPYEPRKAARLRRSMRGRPTGEIFERVRSVALSFGVAFRVSDVMHRMTAESPEIRDDPHRQCKASAALHQLARSGELRLVSKGGPGRQSVFVAVATEGTGA